MDEKQIEAMLKLAEAANRLAAAIEGATGMMGLGRGIQVYHHGFPSYAQSPQYYPGSWASSSMGGGLNGG